MLRINHYSHTCDFSRFINALFLIGLGIEKAFEWILENYYGITKACCNRSQGARGTGALAAICDT